MTFRFVFERRLFLHQRFYFRYSSIIICGPPGAAEYGSSACFFSCASNLTFQGLFKSSVAKKVLLNYVDELERSRPVLLDYKPRSDQALLAALIVNNPQTGPKKVLQWYGLKKAYDVFTPRELRVMFAKYSTRSWYQLMADARDIKLPGAQQATFGVMREQVMKLKTVRLSSYKK